MSYLVLCIVGGLLVCLPAHSNHPMSRYRLSVGLAALAALAVQFFVPQAIVVTPFALFCLAVAAFLWQQRRWRHDPAEVMPVRETTLATEAERLPWFTWLVLGPFVILFLSGSKNRLTILGLELCSWLLIMGVASWYGARRSALRRSILAINIGACYLVALLFAAIVTGFIGKLPAWLFLVAPLVILVPALAKLPRSSEPTPEECWKGGLLYYNSGDAALFVQKRFGIGYTFNFANRWSWILLFGLVLILTSIPFLLSNR